MLLIQDCWQQCIGRPNQKWTTKQKKWTEPQLFVDSYIYINTHQYRTKIPKRSDQCQTRNCNPQSQNFKTKYKALVSVPRDKMTKMKAKPTHYWQPLSKPFDTKPMLTISTLTLYLIDDGSFQRFITKSYLHCISSKI